MLSCVACNFVGWIAGAVASSRMLISHQAVSVLRWCCSSWDIPECWRRSRFANKDTQLDSRLSTSCRGQKHMTLRACENKHRTVTRSLQFLKLSFHTFLSA